MNLQVRIKEVCRQRGITITQLAAKLGIRQVTLSRTITGNPTIETLQKIADALGVPIASFFEAKSNIPHYCTACVNCLSMIPHFHRLRQHSFYTSPYNDTPYRLCVLPPPIEKAIYPMNHHLIYRRSLSKNL